jgi:hypothetical protein
MKITVAAIVAFLGCCVLTSDAQEEKEPLKRLQKLGLPGFEKPVPTYYSEGAKSRAEKLAVDITAMNGFYQTNLGVQPRVSLAVLSSNDWMQVNPDMPYGMPYNAGALVAMPAQGGMVFDSFMRGKASIPADILEKIRLNNTTFEAIAEKEVEWIGFHELGHAIVRAYNIDPRCYWLNELLANYCAIAFVSQAGNEWKILDLIEAPPPPKATPQPKRPKNTTLADFEEPYLKVDDYLWYQGMFCERAKAVCDQRGVGFLKDVKREFPADSTHASGEQSKIAPGEALLRLDKIAPGFVKWAEVFQEDAKEAKAGAQPEKGDAPVINRSV